MPTALVTGASSGIGLEFAEQLAVAGYDLILVARRQDRLEDAADRFSRLYSIASELIGADLETEHGIQEVETRLREGPAVDLLVNNAGFAARAPIAKLDIQAFEAMLRVNVLALVRLSAAGLSRMTEEGKGAIINVASGTGFMQIPGNAGYGSSKSFVIAFTRHMQVEAGGTGVKVQLLIPGVVATEFHEVAGAALANFSPQMVMQSSDLVGASLRALVLDEQVCIPSMPDASDWDEFASAERQVMSNVSKDRVADRYL